LADEPLKVKVAVPAFVRFIPLPASGALIVPEEFVVIVLVDADVPVSVRVVPAIVGVPSSKVMLLTVTAPETVTVKGFVASVPAENKALLPFTHDLSVLELPTPPESVFQTLLLPLVSQVPVGVVPAPAVLLFVSHQVLV